MSRILITAFEPYDHWAENSSWLALVEFTKSMTAHTEITTRLYPVDFDVVRQRLASDLEADYDYAIHLGQNPGSASVRLEAIGINVGGNSNQLPDKHEELVDGGPVAYRTSLPLRDWAGGLRKSGIPAAVSFHAGTYLCNATLYMSHYWIENMGLKTKATFLHLPLVPNQVIHSNKEMASLPAAVSARAIRVIVDRLHVRDPLRGPKLA